jgi:uncharacterized protein YaeQ
MAIKSTIFKVNLTISDMNRHYYQDHAFTLARHPSESDVRMMMRIIAFALNAHEHLQFTKGLGSTEEPDIWEVDLTGGIQHWIDLGQPSDKRIRQSCSKARRVSIYTYLSHKNNAAHWYETVKETASRFEHLEVSFFTIADQTALETFVERNMTLNCMIQSDEIMIADAKNNLTIPFGTLQERRRG